MINKYNNKLKINKALNVLNLGNLDDMSIQADFG